MHRRIPWLLLVALAAVTLLTQPALAGMPAPITLREMARLRIEAISFFLMVLLASAKLIQWLWNGLRASPSRIPRLTYPKSVGLVALWGLLFVVVLAMISGARELMTPGAWKQEGATYRLVPPG
jgi:hypothetical protein